MTSPLFASPFHVLLAESGFRKLLADTLLPPYLQRQRWFTSKGKTITHTTVERSFRVTADSALVLVCVEFGDGSQEHYQLPLALYAAGAERDGLAAQYKLGEVAGAGLIGDAVPRADFRAALFDLVRGGEQRSDGLNCEAGRALGTDLPEEVPSTVPSIDTSNTAIVYADRFFFKLFRKLDPGLNPDLELVRFLSERTDFAHCPPYAGSLGVGDMDAAEYLNLGLMSGKVDNRGDAWSLFQQLAEDRFTGRTTDASAAVARARLLGRRTAQMHRGLASAPPERADLAPVAMTPDYRREIVAAARRLLDRQFTQLAAQLETLPPRTAALAERLLAQREELERRLGRLSTRNVAVDLIRIHGDYHLGQVLDTGDDFTIIDFEGEPLLSIPERRRKRPALKDVGGMVRSFHYAARGQLLLNPDRYADRDGAELAALAEAWYREVAAAYLEAYYRECGGASFLPAEPSDRRALLDLFILEKAIYEVAYELNSRPAWLGIPLGGALGLLAS